MTFGGQVDDSVDLLVPHQLEHALEVADVHLHELVVGLRLDVPKILQISGIRKLVQIDDLVIRIPVDEKSYYVGSYESVAAGNNYIYSSASLRRYCPY